MKWISVKDRLPKGIWNSNHIHLSEEVLIANDVSVLIGFFNRYDGIWYIDEPAGEIWVDDITHWMPLPINPHKGDN